MNRHRKPLQQRYTANARGSQALKNTQATAAFRYLSPVWCDGYRRSAAAISQKQIFSGTQQLGSE